MNSCNIALITGDRDNCFNEVRKWLNEVKADMYVFPESFIKNKCQLDEISKYICENRKTVVIGMTENTSTMYKEVALVFEDGEFVDKYEKTTLTKQEKMKKRISGDTIHCIKLKKFVIGIPICYEIHFPEVVRIMNLETPKFLLNLIGSGMKDEHQLKEWITISKARAIENQVYVLGCSNFRGEIPLAFAISPLGDMIAFNRNINGYLRVSIPLSYKKKYSYMEDRIPHLYKLLCT